MARNSEINQYYAVFCVNIMSVSYGTLAGWPSSSLLVLQSEESPLESGQITEDEASWIGAILCIGGLIGTIIYGWMANKFGRKKSMMLVAIPLAVSWILVIIAKNVTYLLISRFVGGLAGGGNYIVVPLYVTEISEDKIRGTLGSYLVCTCYFGIVLAFILGEFVSYMLLPYLLLLFPLAFIILFAFLPETPQHLLKAQKVQKAEKALRYFRNLRRISEDLPEKFKFELEKLKVDFLSQTDNPKMDENSTTSWEDYTSKAAIKAITIGIVLMALNQFCGCFAMINYTATIFLKAGSTLSPNVSAIIVGAVQFLGACVSVGFVERAGRKLLLTISAIGTGIGLVILGLYSYLDSQPDYDLSEFRWIPLASFSFVLFIAAIGVLTLPFLVVPEITPPKIRDSVSVFCLGLSWLFAFIMVKLLPTMTDSLGMHGPMFIFACCSFAGGIFVMLCIPETKGRSIHEIMALLEK